MNAPRNQASLQELQARFSAALLARAHDDDACADFARDIVAGDLPSLARLRVYRNNSRLVQIDALGRTYGVLKRRVGDEFFAPLATEYREQHPSPSGDLHWIGERFPEWLARRLAQSGYEWLADLARLEWACEQALVAADAPAVSVAALAGIAPERLADVRLTLQPSLRLMRSDWPVWSVWRENQPEANGAAVDLAAGPEHVLVACVDGALVLLSVAGDEFGFIAALLDGHGLGAALENSRLPVDRLAAALGRLFEEGLVTDALLPDRESCE